SEGVTSLYSSIIAIVHSAGRSFLSAVRTDASAMAEAHAAHYFWFGLGTEIATESRHSDRRRRSLDAIGSDEPRQVAGLCCNGVSMRRGSSEIQAPPQLLLHDCRRANAWNDRT